MPEKLKNIFFTKDSIKTFANSISKHYPEFDTQQFFKLIYFENWHDLELKEKMRHTTLCLHQCLPEDYLVTLVILTKAAPEVKGFESMTFPDFVEVYGMEHWEESLNALGYFTQFYSSEFAIRPFLDKNPELTMHYMKTWAMNINENVRRFASEGCRPRLPWAMILPQFIINPKPVLEVLEVLKDDESEFVRKSVANNLNDISKDHPEIVLDTCKDWFGKSSRTDWIIKHGCRTLLKKGNVRALRLFGFGDPKYLSVKNLKLSKAKVKIGDEINYSFDLVNLEKNITKIRIEYAIDFVKANGKTSKKIFQIIEKDFQPGKNTIKRKHSFRDLSTRKHYPGIHTIRIIVNGIEKKVAELTLIKK